MQSIKKIVKYFQHIYHQIRQNFRYQIFSVTKNMQIVFN